MASDNEACCESDPNFAVICAFFDKFGETCGLANFDFLALQEMLENTQEVHQQLVDLHIRLLRRAKKTVSNEKWERAVIKFCHTFCIQDAWEIERFGYKKARISSKLRVLKELLELQFDLNSKFKSEINKMSAEELRSQPLGKDNLGHAYWYQNDTNCQIRVYKEDPDEETWTLVAKDRDGLVSLINELSDGDSKISSDTTMNEDSNSLAEKPIIDTGQVDSSSDSKNSDSNSKEASKEAEEPCDLKRPRESDGEESPPPKRAPQEQVEVSEAVEEPLMLVKGEGAGADDNASPIVGDEVEDPVVFVCGSGSGSDCLTGNENKSGDGSKSESGNHSKDKDTSDKNCEGLKSPYKLGTIVDIKTDNKLFNRERSPTKKSRWDVETFTRTEPSKSLRKDLQSAGENKEVVPVRPMFFFGPGCLAFKPKVTPASCSATMGFGQKVPQVDQQSQNANNKSAEISIPANVKGDIGYRIKDSDETRTDEIKHEEIKPEIDSKLSEAKEKRIIDVAESENTDAAKLTEQDIPKEEIKISIDVQEPEIKRQVEEEPLSPKVEKELPEEVPENKPQGEVTNKEELEEKIPEINDLVEVTEMKKQDELPLELEPHKKNPETPIQVTEKSKQLEVLKLVKDPLEKKPENLHPVELTKKEKQEELPLKLQKEEPKDENQHPVEVAVKEEPSQLEIKVQKEPGGENPVGLSEKEERPKLPLKIETELLVTQKKVEEDEEILESPQVVEEPVEPQTEVQEKEKSLKAPVEDLKEIIVQSLKESEKPQVVALREIPLELTKEIIEVSKIQQVPKVVPLDVKPTESTPKTEVIEKVMTVIEESVKTEAATDLTISDKSIEIDNRTEPKDEEICDEPKNEDASTLSSALEKEKTKEILTTDDDKTVHTKSKIVQDLSIVEDNSLQKISETFPPESDNKLIVHDIETPKVDDVIPKTELKPVAEEICTKKFAYTCGETSDQEDKETTEETTKISSKIIEKPQEVAENLTVNHKEAVIPSKEPEVLKIEKDLPPVNDAPQDLSLSVPVGKTETTDLTKFEESETPHDLTVQTPKLSDKSSDLLQVEEKRTPIDTCKNNNATPEQLLGENESTSLEESRQIMEESSPEKTPTRRGRPKGSTKAEISKKMKLNESEEEPRTTRQTRSKPITENIAEVKDDEKPKDSILEPAGSPESVISDGNDFTEIPERDPLDNSDGNNDVDGDVKAPMSLSTFSLDFNETAPILVPSPMRSVRKRGRESPTKENDDEETAGKRIKMRGKRSVDVQLRKSIEEQKKHELASSDDDVTNEEEEVKEEAKVVTPSKKRGRKKKGKKGFQIKRPVAKSPEDGEVATSQESPEKKNKNKNKRLLSNLGITLEEQQEAHIGIVGVRQSRRIAQLKIREEAERVKLEDEMARGLELDAELKLTKKKSDKEKKSKKQSSTSSDDDGGGGDDDSVKSDKKKKKKKKRKMDPRKLFDENNPWRSSSDSSSSNVEDEDEEIEEDDEQIQYNVSDHEFSPESDLEAEGAQPLKRARTARKESDVEEEVDDCPCQKCGKSDHPEWILLCDSCDNGWHCSCLRPPLLVIPEGDWFCPPCQHVRLLENLQLRLKGYDKLLNKKEIADRRKERLAYVGISLNNVLPAKDSDPIKKKRRRSGGADDGDGDDDDEGSSSSDESGSESESESGSQSEAESDSDEPIYQLRQRRQAHCYRFNDYDELINSAIQDEIEAVKGAGNQGRGKDIATIVNAEKEEEWPNKESGEGEVGQVPEESVEDETPESLPPVVPQDTQAKPVQYEDDVEAVKRRKRVANRRKHRKLNSLDITSEEDDASDEDFKETSGSEEEFDEDELNSEETDEEFDTRKGRRRNLDPVRRSTRARTSRYDADFIDDGESDEDDDAPRKKKKRSIWDESESEESDKSWGRRKKKPARTTRKPPASSSSSNKKKKSKKKKKDEDSDVEVYKKKKPKIKFGMDGEDEGPGRRTRGKKINYVDALGSDSDEDRVKRAPPRIESEEEYVANEDEEIDEDDKVSDEEDASGEEGEESKAPPKIQSYADARFTQPLPEGVPTPKNLNDCESEPNPIDEINKNLEAMDENEMEKMMEEEEYANKQLHMVAVQIEKEKKRKEREAKKLQNDGEATSTSAVLVPENVATPKKRGRKPKGHFQFPQMQDPVVGNVDSLIVNTDNNDELSEPPGVALPLFANLDNDQNDPKKRRTQGVVVQPRGKKSIEETVSGLGMRQEGPAGAFMGLPPPNKDLQETNIEIAAPPQPFSQSQPTPSVITRMLQSKPGQPGYPVGAIRPKQFAAMPEREEDPNSPHHPIPGQFLPGGVRPPLVNPYGQLPPRMSHYPRGVVPPPPHQIRNPVPQAMAPHIYHSHRALDPSPSGGGAMNMSGHSSPGRVASPASSSPNHKTETPPPPYSRPPPVTRFPMVSNPVPMTTTTAPRHLHMVAPHLQPPRPNMSPYHPNLPPTYHYGAFPPQAPEEGMPPGGVYQTFPPEQFASGEGHPGAHPSENSNSKSYDEAESGGEFGGLVSYFSSQREDDLES